MFLIEFMLKTELSFVIQVSVEMPRTCIHCAKYSQEVGDYRLCWPCTLNTYTEKDGAERFCGNGSRCVNKKSEHTSRSWVKEGRCNYQIHKDGTINFQRYCHACFNAWAARTNETELLRAENQKLRFIIQQQDELIRWLAPPSSDMPAVTPEIQNWYCQYE